MLTAKPYDGLLHHSRLRPISLFAPIILSSFVTCLKREKPLRSQKPFFATGICKCTRRVGFRVPRLGIPLRKFPTKMREWDFPSAHIYMQNARRKKRQSAQPFGGSARTNCCVFSSRAWFLFSRHFAEFIVDLRRLWFCSRRSQPRARSYHYVVTLRSDEK